MIDGCDRDASVRLTGMHLFPHDRSWSDPAVVTIGGEIGGPPAVCCTAHIDECKSLWNSPHCLGQLAQLTEQDLGFRPDFDSSRTLFQTEEVV
jgi:hypothetical protein